MEIIFTTAVIFLSMVIGYLIYLLSNLRYRVEDLEDWLTEMSREGIQIYIEKEEK